MAVIDIDTSSYQSQLDEKVQTLNELFKDVVTPELEVFTSPDSYYRMRAEFKIWHQEDRSFFAMFNPADKKNPLEVKHFPVANKRINELMDALLAEVHQEPLLRFKLFQMEFLTSTTDDALVTFIYHRKLEDDWLEIAKNLEQKYGIAIIGRSRKQKIVLSKDYVNESFAVAGKSFAYRQYENSFSQPNAAVCEKMLNWAVDKSKGFGQDLLELYCGNGNFTLPLAQNFDRVCATEISKISVRSAQENAQTNNIENVEVFKISSEDFSAAWLKRDPAKLAKFDLAKYNFSSVFVDPPRAGLDDDTVELVRNFDQIIYISCNPETLKNNVEALKDTHEVVEFALFDQFPYTHHMESGVVLKARK